MPKRIMMVAGEASGDLHGASLARELKLLLPDIELMGMGGSRMEQAGVRLLVHCAGASVVGSVEALGSLGTILRSFLRLSQGLKEERPDLLILIDYPEFNLLLGRLAKRRKVPIIYYISPQIWAWRSGRLKTLRRLVDRILVILPFEENLYRGAGMDVHFVGHPLLDQEKPTISRYEVRKILVVPEEGTLIGLMPGSRRGEVERHLPRMLKAAAILSQEDPQLSFIVSQADSIEDKVLAGHLSGFPPGCLTWRGRSCDLINACDLLIVASGTVTLEAGLLGIPMVIIYRLSWFSWILGKIVVQVKQVGLINLILGGEVVPELLQRDASPERIAGATRDLLQNPWKRKELREKLLSVRSKLGEEGASRRAALHIHQFMASRIRE